MRKKKRVPVRHTMCATCPFRPGSEFESLAGYLAQSAISEGNRICHSTGTSAIHGRTGKRSAICRGARNIQLKLFFGMGFLTEATDASWDAKMKECGL